MNLQKCTNAQPTGVPWASLVSHIEPPAILRSYFASCDPNDLRIFMVSTFTGGLNATIQYYWDGDVSAPWSNSNCNLDLRPGDQSVVGSARNSSNRAWTRTQLVRWVRKEHIRELGESRTLWIGVDVRGHCCRCGGLFLSGMIRNSRSVYLRT